MTVDVNSISSERYLGSGQGFASCYLYKPTNDFPFGVLPACPMRGYEPGMPLDGIWLIIRQHLYSIASYATVLAMITVPLVSPHLVRTGMRCLRHTSWYIVVVH